MSLDRASVAQARLYTPRVGSAERWAGRRPLPEDVAERVAALAPLFERHGVRLAYLFGSLAAGRQGARDVDLAVLPGPSTDDYELRVDIGERLGTDRFDLVDLGQANDVVRFEVIRGGRVLYAATPDVENDFERRTIAEYKDREPVRRRRAEGLFQ